MARRATRDPIRSGLPQPTVLSGAPDLNDIIDRLYSLVDKAMQPLEKSDAKLGPREIGSLVNLAKMLPMLEEAEIRKRTPLGSKTLKDMSTKELESMAKRFLRAPTRESEDEDG